MTKKKPEPNPIEEAIGNRAKPKTPEEDFEESMAKTLPEITTPIPQNPSETPDEPSPQEMLTLEELNRQTVERLQDQYPEEKPPMTEIPITNVSGERVNVPQAAYPPLKIPVSKPDHPAQTKPSSPESPVETIDKHPEIFKPPAEDVELLALRKYIFEDGFVVATVAFHIVTLCAEPMTTPSTTTWDFADRAMIPEMVFALLNQPGYLEGIWPSLKIVMSSNKGNSAWCAGIATTLAFFDVIRTLPAIEELKQCSPKE